MAVVAAPRICGRSERNREEDGGKKERRRRKKRKKGGGEEEGKRTRWVRSDQKSQFWAKFSTILNIPGFYQVSSLEGLEWSNMSILGQIFNATQNFCISPNFILCRSGVAKNLNLEPNFQRNSTFLDVAKFNPPQVRSGQKSQFSAKSSMYLNISGFCQISSFLSLEWSMWLKISGFCQISSFLCLEWSKISIFEPSFQHDPKFLDFAKFYSFQLLRRSRVVKNLNFQKITNNEGLPHQLFF